MMWNHKESISEHQGKGKRDIIKLAGIIVALAFIIVVSVVGVRIYNSPVNQISRQLDLGYKYLENGEYEEAILAFEKAIAIDDRCMEAYVGGLEAYLNIGDEESLQAFYDRAMSVADNLDGELLVQNMGYVLEIYQMVDTVYADMPQQAIEVLEKGWSVTDEPEIGNKLAENYFAIAKERDKSGNYEDELKIYDRLLELEKADDRVLESLEKCLIAYLEFLLKDGRYDEITALVEKYRDIATGIDFDKYLEQMKETMAEESSEEKDRAEIAEEEIQEGTGVESGQEFEEFEGNEDESIEKKNTADASQSSSWVDDLRQKIVAEDAESVFSIITAPDFIENCEIYPHTGVVAWSIDYHLSTSDGEDIWVVKSVESPELYVAYYPEGYNYGFNTNAQGEILDAPAVGWGDYCFAINFNGQREWFAKESGQRGDGSAYEIPENAIWMVFHM